jgi:hypothetical protein
MASCFLEEWLVLGLGQEIHQIRHLSFMVSESKEMLKIKHTHTHTHTHTHPLHWCGCVKETQGPNERTSKEQNWNNLSNKANEVVLDFCPKYKINIHVKYPCIYIDMIRAHDMNGDTNFLCRRIPNNLCDSSTFKKVRVLTFHFWSKCTVTCSQRGQYGKGEGRKGWLYDGVK